MVNVAEAKQQARQLAFERRAALTQEARDKKSSAICSDLFSFVSESACSCSEDFDPPTAVRKQDVVDEAGKAFFIAAYYEIKNEVSLADFRTSAWDAGWRVLLPCMKEPGHMEFYDVERSLVENKILPFIQYPARCYSDEEIEAFLAENGIPAEVCYKVDPLRIDFAIVPLVAFNPETGGRLGYGGGNYDRYVPRMRKGITMVGVAFDEQRIDGLELEEHDCEVSHVFTA